MEQSFRAKVWEDEEQVALERQAYFREHEAKNLYVDDARARLDLQKWLALEQFVQSDGWTAFVSWLGPAYDAAAWACISEQHQAAIRIAQGSAQALASILRLPIDLPTEIQRAKAALVEVERRKQDADVGRVRHPQA